MPKNYFELEEVEMNDEAPAQSPRNEPSLQPAKPVQAATPTSQPKQASAALQSVAPQSSTVVQQYNAWITPKRLVLLQAILGEGLVTCLFIFSVCAFQLNTIRSGHVDEQGLIVSAIGTAFCSIALIYSFADVSGAHFNCAVTFATVITGKTSWQKSLAYLGIQITGSLGAMIMLSLCFSGDIATMLTVAPDASASLINIFFMEFFQTFILVYVIFAVAFDTVDTKPVHLDLEENEDALAKGDTASTNAVATAGQKQKSIGKNLTIYTTTGNTKAGFAPISIGFTLGFLCFIGGSVSGGAFNPIRVLAPVLIGGSFQYVWLYWFADCLGAAAAGCIQQFIFARKQEAQS